MTTPIEEARERLISDIVRDICELPGDTDHNDPEAVILTVSELQIILERHLESTPSPVTVEAGEVTQADRGAAANMIRSYWQPWHDGDWHKLASSIEAGSCDHSPFVQVLFRHRLAALSTIPKPAKVADREGLIAKMKANEAYSGEMHYASAPLPEGCPSCGALPCDWANDPKDALSLPALEGGKLVPVEATDAMCDAASLGYRYESHQVSDIWSAMLAASPSPAALDEWKDIESAPYDTAVIVKAGDMTFKARLLKDVSMSDMDTPCDQWQAEIEGQHPPCWSGSACWTSNENEVMSLQPTAWMPSPAASEGSDNG